MRIKGHIFSGVLRGQPLIELFFYRIAGLLGFEPYKGTMDVELESLIDIRMFATRTLDHVLMDGKTKIDAYFAPVDIIFQKEDKEERYRCWVLQQVDGPYGNDVVELIAKDMLREKFGLKEHDEVEIEFFELPHDSRKSLAGVLSKFMPHHKGQLMKR